MAKRIRLGLVGIGKIARDQHLPALAADDRFELAATASRSPHQVDGVPGHGSIEEMIAAGHDLDAVPLCTPPQGRHQLAAAAIEAGLHVMMEKPPAATLSEVEDLARRAEAKGVVLYTSWHSRAAAGVEPAREWLAGKQVTGLRITWKEDIRRWHPGQEWILGPGGFGVFDPGINALSIATHILPQELFVTEAALRTPENRHAPIAASLKLRTGGADGSFELDFLQTGPQTWDIEVDTDGGTLKLHEGGSKLALPGEEPRAAENREYPNLYAHFAELVAARRSDVDVRPLRLVADAMLVASHERAEAFTF
ncbi:Gfo/Idh/MocA family protein [Sphingomonas lenta]|uniref:Galactose 1-dehydrogenase n=1 Tax=Sphingomonas lenta TaxID=1141887 RepID=A0A2A2SFR2_9SPHN|nr:Gfo/Idh/MocA family oxidoreductase [Sphingomonas lenta]PAX08068.1 galactose 1-dehydrogenase [Sphingomonas lenta]